MSLGSEMGKLKLCKCGCGNAAPVSKRNRKERGVIKGQVSPYIRWHEPIALRFWKYVNKCGPLHPTLRTRCWLWTGSTNADGYGQCTPTVAHRVAWFIATGCWPKKCALHRCDNPPCVRFSHLYDGSKGDNNRERTAKGRQVKGSAVHSAVLTEAQVKSIRRLLAKGVKQYLLVERYGVNRDVISSIKRGRTWKHVT
jgi:hypothetical protein